MAGGSAGVISRSITAPLERVKIAAQTSGRGISISSELGSVYRKNGLRGLFAGNGANCLRVFPQGAIVVSTCKFKQISSNGLVIVSPATAVPLIFERSRVQTCTCCRSGLHRKCLLCRCEMGSSHECNLLGSSHLLTMRSTQWSRCGAAAVALSLAWWGRR